MANEKNIINEIQDYVPNIIDFTRSSEEHFYDTVDLEEFREKEADFIYDCLRKKLRLIPFCDYLKRYIFIKSGLKGDFRDIDIREYQEIIVESFRENHTPASFSETTAKLSALSKNWLTQESVNRQIIFLLGFGLKMSVDDVSSFLIKAQKERDFNFKDPVEIIYWYCFKNNYNFARMNQLKKIYKELPADINDNIYDNQTKAIRDMFKDVNDDQTLLMYLSKFKTHSQKCSYSITSYKWFTELYFKCREIIANFYNNDESDNLEKKIQEYLDTVQGSTKLTEMDKKNKIEKIREMRKIWIANEINESDVEKILCCGTPIDDSGNLLKLSVSKLAKHFNNKRMNRQHIGEVLNKKISVDRFDLISLNFFIFSHDEKYSKNKSRYIAFIDKTNEILNECSMGELYVANPYECFLLMCIVSDSPFPIYSEVWEKSFEEF